MIPYIVTVLILIFILSQVVKIMNEYERGVIFRLGRLIASKGPGIIFLIPLIDKLQKIEPQTGNFRCSTTRCHYQR